jgi:divalent metal cation (Fe/Co/Zn/Cd) transporter
MLVFILGIGMLVAVLFMAFSMFTSPISLALNTGGAAGSTPNTASLGTAIAWIVVKIVLLFVMTLAASSIASKGIYLYLGSSERK